jgi:acetyl esterase/lipase
VVLQMKMRYTSAVVYALLFSMLSTSAIAAEKTVYKISKDISYLDTTVQKYDDYAKQRCKLDVYYPGNKRKVATVVWFHGGGLTGGEKFVPDQLKEQGFVIVAVNYRLSPKVKSPVYIEDAAAAVAWTFKNIHKYNGDPKKIVISGHSAGGYLTSMVGLDKKYLAAHNIDANNIAALVPFSGHTITHFTVRQERGIPPATPIIDDLAPLFHVRNDLPPLILITGDRDLEMLGRYEENAYLMRMMKVVGHKKTQLYELQGHNHGDMAKPAHTILLKYLRKNFP